MPRSRCLCGCGQLVEGARCKQSRSAQRVKYGGTWRQESRDYIAVHVMTYGYVCPGWATAPHQSRDLTTDHGPPRRVLCRACNSRKQASGAG